MNKGTVGKLGMVHQQNHLGGIFNHNLLEPHVVHVVLADPVLHTDCVSTQEADTGVKLPQHILGKVTMAGHELLPELSAGKVNLNIGLAVQRNRRGQ